ncbi:MAG: hypothetical protein ABEJ43_02055 [Haloferacaceae archaeon]
MSSGDAPPNDDPLAAVSCASCRTALRGGGTDAVSFLLLEGLRVPLVGCEDHLARFARTCGLTSEGSADLLEHRPAGGVGCPACRLAPRRPDQFVVPVADGAVAIVACETHRDATRARYEAGGEAREHLSADVDDRVSRR